MRPSVHSVTGMHDRILLTTSAVVLSLRWGHLVVDCQDGDAVG